MDSRKYLPPGNSSLPGANSLQYSAKNRPHDYGNQMTPDSNFTQQ